MSTADQPSGDTNAKRKLSLEKPVSEETLVVETDEDEDEVVLASRSDGSSLTLLEEYSMKNESKGKRLALLALLCAAASITFAFKIFQTL